MKSLTNPPQPVISVMSAFVILFEDDLKKEQCEIIYLPNKKSGKSEIDYLNMFKKYLGKDVNKFITMIRTFNPDNVSQSTLTKLNNIIKNEPEFNFPSMLKKSKAAAYFVKWIMSIHDYLMVKSLEER